MAWYTGFGQWLGALGSLIAAAVALGIATTDRRQAAKLRQAEQDDRAADLAREAGLVRVQISEIRVGSNVSRSLKAWVVTVRNWRKSRLFEVELTTIKAAGMEKPPEIRLYRKWNADGTEGRVPDGDLEFTPISHGEALRLFPEGETVLEYAAVRYTDDTGSRWEVDSETLTARKVS